MRLSIPFRLWFFVILISPINSLAQGFETYSQEISFLKSMLDCPKEKMLPPMNGFGALYICTLGDAKTVKLFFSEKPDSGRVLNVGMVWNDSKVNLGYGIHSDLKEAQEALNFLIYMYVPSRKNEIKEAFWNSKSVQFSTSDFLIYLTHKAGLQKDERLIVLEEK